MGKVLEPWIEIELEPKSPAEFADCRPVCYVLEDYGLSNALILERACREAGLPSPLQPDAGRSARAASAPTSALSRRNANTLKVLASRRAPNTRTALRLARAPAAGPSRGSRARRAAGARLDLRRGARRTSTAAGSRCCSPKTGRSLAASGRLLAILLNGRSTAVQFAPPVSVRASVEKGLDPERTVRKLSARAARALSAASRRDHRARPVTRRLLADQVLSADS
jgi:glycerol-3-phosphate O-acyltransferase